MKMRRTGAWALGLVALALLGGALVAPPIGAEEGAKGAKAFETPDALVDAMVAAAEANDDAALKALVGPTHAAFIQPGGDPSVAKVRATFVERVKQFRKLEDGEDGSKTLVIGDNRWPFPVPIVKTAAGWVLDLAAGKEEIRARRIGKNELNAIKTCRAYIDLQVEYASKDRDGDKVREYAQKIKSTEGKRDGLYWPEGDDGESSPLGPFVASASEYLRDRRAGDPFGGYYWKVLWGQGRCAPGGSHSYVINGNMIAGFALIGFPAKYGETGIMTFMVSHHGDVVERDLGSQTAAYASQLEWFCPDVSWTKVED